MGDRVFPVVEQVTRGHLRSFGVWKMIILHEPDKVFGANSGDICHQVIHLRPLPQVI